jgi:hypothetical protein
MPTDHPPAAEIVQTVIHRQVRGASEQAGSRITDPGQA